MSGNNVISVEGLGKRYRIGVAQKRARNLREALTRIASSPFKYLSSRLRGPTEEEILWALRDVSFEVEQGQVLGIIGRNGAGKSTLLKILSRITDPTEGRALIRGRVNSLLEVGTGFHPELTGRENIFLNAAMHGMRRTEIARNLDEIIAFAEVEKFIDTPVKRYSSGMYTRLAFAVAAHLEPEILIVDEVLAVGDADFQKKCMGKMGSVAKEGRTVLFVSHNMAAVSNLCGSCVLLKNGSVQNVGDTRAIIGEYLDGGSTRSAQDSIGEYDLSQRKNPYADGALIARNMSLLDGEGRARDSFLMGQEMRVVVHMDGLSRYRDGWVGAIFKSRDGQVLAGISTGMTCSKIHQPRSVRERAMLSVPRLPFTPGRYSIDISITQGSTNRVDYVGNAASFTVTEADVYGTGYRVSGGYGVFFLDAQWEIVGNRDCPGGS